MNAERSSASGSAPRAGTRARRTSATPNRFEDLSTRRGLSAGRHTAAGQGTHLAPLWKGTTHAATNHPHPAQGRSEEHTSELQSRENLVCRLLLEKKKKNKK